jgi:hypothetical protein
MPGPRRLPGSGMTGSSVPLGTLRTLVNGSAHEADRHVIGTWGGHVFRQQPCHRGIREAGAVPGTLRQDGRCYVGRLRKSP